MPRRVGNRGRRSDTPRRARNRGEGHSVAHSWSLARTNETKPARANRRLKGRWAGRGTIDHNFKRRRLYGLRSRAGRRAFWFIPRGRGRRALTARRALKLQAAGTYWMGLREATGKGAAGIMATTTKKKVAAKTSRHNELKKMLEERRRELLNSVHGKIRDCGQTATRTGMCWIRVRAPRWTFRKTSNSR